MTRKAMVKFVYPTASWILILLLCILATSLIDSNMNAAKALEAQSEQQELQPQQLQQQSGTISGGGTSEVIGGVCTNFHNNDFLTIRFDASFLLSSDGKTGKVTSGSGILKTTYSNVFGYLSITDGTINIGVRPNLYSLKGTASFQSLTSSPCRLPSAVEFTISKQDGTQLKCGNSDLITFNSKSIRGSVTGNVVCTHSLSSPAVGKSTTIPQNNNINTRKTPPENVKIISATDGRGKRISNGAINIPSKSITFQLSTPIDNVGIASTYCNIDGSTKICSLSPSTSSSATSIVAYNNLNPGRHTFTFIAKDAAGNVSSDRFTWTISPNANN